MRRYVDTYNAAEGDSIARKLGLRECGESDVVLMQELRDWLQRHEVDMSIFFRALAKVDVAGDTADTQVFADAWYDAEKRDEGEAPLR
ncbi:hypothetical protein AB4084_37910, partial [Lysobacter sp. 2RAB21]